MSMPIATCCASVLFYFVISRDCLRRPGQNLLLVQLHTQLQTAFSWFTAISTNTHE